MEFLRNAVFIWTTLAAISSGTASFLYREQVLLFEHLVDVGLFALTLITTLILYFLFLSLQREVQQGFADISENQLRSDVDRFHKAHINDPSLSEDEAKYLYRLKDKVADQNINSFTERQLTELSQIPINRSK